MPTSPDMVRRHSPEQTRRRALLPEKANFRIGAGSRSRNPPFVMFTNSPLPIGLTHTSKRPSRSETNDMNLPSGEIAASTSSPSKSVTRSILASASGLRQK